MRVDKLHYNQESEVRNAMAFWTKKDPGRLIAMRVLFEAAADLCLDEMAHYLRSRKLRALLSNRQHWLPIAFFQDNFFKY